MQELDNCLLAITKLCDDIIVIDRKRLAIVVSDKSGLALKCRKILKDHGIDYSVKQLSIRRFLEPGIISRLLEGYSLKRRTSLHNIIGLHEFIIVTYSLKNLDHIKKTIFGYALKGRGKNNGILSNVKGEMCGRNCILLPKSMLPQLQDLFNYWELDYSIKPVFKLKSDHPMEGMSVKQERK